MKPGVYHGLDIAAYHSGAGLSKTGLDLVHRSPAHYFASYRDPNRPAEVKKESHLLGNLAHCAIFEPFEFEKRYSVHPEMHRGTKAWKEIAEQAAQEGREPIQIDQFNAARDQARSVRQLANVWGDLSAWQMLKQSAPEVSAYWVDPVTKVLCRCRPDAVFPVNDRQVVLLDAKTFGDAREFEFSRQVAKMRYHVQDGFYSEGYAAASGMEVVAFIFLVVEDKWPYAAAAYRLDDESRFEGIDEVRRLLPLYAECDRTGIWPGYATSTTALSLPPYALTSGEVEISYAE